MSSIQTTSESSTRLDGPVLRRIFVLLLGGIMGILDATMVGVATDTLAVRFSASLATVGWVASGYLLAVAAMVPVAGWAVGRFGAKRLWLFALAVFLLGSLAAAFSWDIASLIGFRVLQGLGAGFLEPLLLTMLARAAGPARTGRVMGLMGVVLSLGPVLGPVLGGLVLSSLDWRWMFWINLPIGALAFLGALRMIPTDEPGNAGRFDLLGFLLLGPGFALSMLGLARLGEEPGTLGAILPLVAGIALLACYLPRALRGRREPILNPRLFTNRGFTGAVAVMLFTGAAMFSITYLFPLYYQQLRGFGQFAAGLLIAPYGIGSALSMPYAGRLADRIGTRGLAGLGAAGSAVVMLGLGFAGTGTGLGWVLIGLFLVGAAMGLVAAPTMGSLYRSLPEEQMAQGSSALYMLNQFGASFGVALVMVLMQGGAGYPGAAWWIAGALLAVVLVARLLPKPQH
ncbi:DHA2 family efflux MFS transporter permease subunit [Sciscionella sediminilitoris]|uniref:DHA2 family efflux MFS transporter permease subunit n=1 Tax=Sciscionella sediminilitoris TaxID=1445613 RepID=UPI000AF8DC8D|nr:DHA2 family efflux MFS transporter permease subunit [Sciscionella sp. SE31]